MILTYTLFIYKKKVCILLTNKNMYFIMNKQMKLLTYILRIFTIKVSKTSLYI